MPPGAEIGNTVQTLSEVTEVTVTGVTMEWKIKNFFSLSNKVDKYYESPTFSFADSVWCLWLYPNSGTGDISTGQTPTSWLGLFLCRHDSEPNKVVKYTFGIKCSDGVEEKEEAEVEFSPKNDGWGLKHFWSRAELKNQASRLMPDNILTITCCLKYSEPVATKVSPHSRIWEVSHNMKRVLADGKWSDFTLKLGDRKWPVHKAILESRCEYFANMFRHEWAENSVGEVTFDDIGEYVLSKVLHFIYTGFVEDMSVYNVCDIYVAAYMFLLDDLKALCIEYMKGEMCLEILYKALIIADTYGEGDLYQKAVECFMLEEDRIFDSEEWKKFKIYQGSVAAELLEETIKRRKKGAVGKKRLDS